VIRGHGQVYRRVFEPIAQIGDIVALRNQDGFVTDKSPSPFYVVTSVGSTGHALGVKGMVGIWCATAAFGAPYKADTSCQQGTNLAFSIPSLGIATLQSVAALQLVTRQLMQTRYLVRSLPDSNGAFITTPEDFDVVVQSPPSSRNWGTQAIPGVLNARFQDSLGSDNIPAPTQGLSQTRFLGSALHAFDGAYRTEIFVYGTLGASCVITNNGSAATTTGGLGLEIAGFPMNLFPLPDVTMVDDWLLGYTVSRPKDLNLNDVIVVPVQTQTSPKSTGT